MKADVYTQITALSEEVRQRTLDEISKENQAYRIVLDNLKDQQAADTFGLRRTHAKEREDLARAITAGEPLDIGKAITAKPEPQKAEPPRVIEPPALPAPHLTVQTPIGASAQARRKATLQTEKEKRVADRLRNLKEQNRPQWAELFRQQRAEQRQFQKAQSAILPRLIYHLRHRDRNENLPAGILKALLGIGHDRKALEARQEAERKALARQIRNERRRATEQEDMAYKRDLAALEKELAREQVIYRQAVEAGTKTPDRQPEPQTLREEFRKRVGGRIRRAKQREGRGKGIGRERGRE